MQRRLGILAGLVLATLVAGVVGPCVPVGVAACRAAGGPTDHRAGSACGVRPSGCCDRPAPARAHGGIGALCSAPGACAPAAGTPCPAPVCGLSSAPSCPLCICIATTPWTVPPAGTASPRAGPDAGSVPAWHPDTGASVRLGGAPVGYGARPRGPPPDLLAVCCRRLI